MGEGRSRRKNPQKNGKMYPEKETKKKKAHQGVISAYCCHDAQPRPTSFSNSQTPSCEGLKPKRYDQCPWNQLVLQN